MALADSGGYDLVLELSLQAVERQLRPLIASPSTDVPLAIPGWGTLTFSVKLGLAELVLMPDSTVRAGISTAGTELCWPPLDGGVAELDPGGCAPVSISASLSSKLVAHGTSLSAEFAPDAFSVDILPGTLEHIPGITAWLSLVKIVHGEEEREIQRAWLYHSVEGRLAAPLNLALPDSLPIATLPSPPVRTTEVVAAGQELRVLMTIGGTPGDPCAIWRSAIRRSPAGQPLGLAGVVIGNACVLRDLLRPVLTEGLGLPASGFHPTHPCYWFGDPQYPTYLPASTRAADVTAHITSVNAGIDAAGMIRVAVRFAGRHSTDAFGISGRLSMGIAATIGGDDHTRTLRLSISASVVDALDLWVAEWVYALVLAGVGSPLLTLAIALADACAGDAFKNAINEGVQRAVGSGTLALPLPSSGIGQISLSSAQPDAEWRTLRIAALTIPDPYPANDVILSIG